MIIDGTVPALGIAHFTVIEVPPLALVQLAARVGYARIGLRLHPAFPGAPFYEIPPGGDLMREMRRRMDGEGVGVFDIEFVVIDEHFAPASLTAMLESAGALGAHRLSVCGDDPDRSRLVDKFAQLCDLAGGFGMSVDLECMAWRQVSSLAKAVEVVQAARAPNGGVLVDALHFARGGGQPQDLTALPPALVRHAQLCDAPLARPATNEALIEEARSRRLLPGSGEQPLRELIAALPDDFSLSVEIPMKPGDSPDRHAAQVFQATQALLRSCRRPSSG